MADKIDKFKGCPVHTMHCPVVSASPDCIGGISVIENLGEIDDHLARVTNVKVTRAALHAAILQMCKQPGKSVEDRLWLSTATAMLEWLDKHFEYKTDSQGYLVNN